MAAKPRITRPSGRTANSRPARVRPSSESKVAASRPGRRSETRQNTQPVTAFDAGQSLAECLQKEREQIFKAISIVECCWYATVTKWAVDDQEYMIPAFETVCDLLNDAGEGLEAIASACEKFV
ncbi:MAG TPA: hypothetical protein VG963_27815 [Polyangiaceae bacterium]|nr:hypothetical protein [Polyangiaceae bacterium]